MSVSRSRRQAVCLCNLCFLIIFINFFPRFAHPLSFSINQFNPGTKGVVYEGDAQPLSGVIELNTVIYSYRAGRAICAEPLHLWDTTTGSLADFTTHFSFVVDFASTLDEYFSDGIAFFLAPAGYPIPPNSGGGELGLFNSTTNFNALSRNQIVTVEFDTWANYWDPGRPHIGININEITSVIYADWNVSNIIGKLGNAWITYNATAKNLTVFWTFNEGRNPVSVGTISSLTYHVDLQKVLPEWVTIGFSAATGLYPGRHVIHSWEFNSTLVDNDIKRVKSKEKTFWILVIEVPVFILTLGVVICWLVVLKKRRNNSPGDACDESSTNTDLERLAFPKRFSYQELFAATNGFANDRRIGQGGSGQVYKGLLQILGGCTVAVKRIFAESDQQCEKIFINEVKIISRLIHRNLVQFIGWCHEQGECLLVYAYMPNTSLDIHLFGTRTTLQWAHRYKIALGLASALHYLHEEAEQCVLHRDIKSANVMLDNDFSTKLGDFGIAKLVDSRFRTQTRGVVGTFGYMAPEYANEGRASKESDMFSFGVVALEIACGRKTYQDGEYHLPLFSWVWQLHLAGNLLDAADEGLEMNYNGNEMKCLLIAGLWCTHPNNKKRPNAGQVMKVLQLEAPLPELPKDMHDHSVLPAPQQQTQAASSQIHLTSSSLTTVGR